MNTMKLTRLFGVIIILTISASVYAAWHNPASWIRSNDAYSKAYADGIPPNRAYASDLSKMYDYAANDFSSDGSVPTRSSIINVMPKVGGKSFFNIDRSEPTVRRIGEKPKKTKSAIGTIGSAITGRGWLWKTGPTPTPPPYTQFSSYSAGFHDQQGDNYTQTTTFRPEDYLTDPPPGLVPNDDPIELWMAAGVGRYGDYEFDLLGGTPEEPTPTGVFTVISKDAKYWSRKYDAAMPYAIFFKTGYALHYGALDKPSHGCVHLPYEIAQRMYYCSKVGKTKVIIHP